MITDVQWLSCFFQPLDANFRNITGDSPKPLEQLQGSGPVCLSYTAKSCAQSKVAVTSRAHINVGVKATKFTDLSIEVETGAVADRHLRHRAPQAAVRIEGCEHSLLVPQAVHDQSVGSNFGRRIQPRELSSNIRGRYHVVELRR